MCGSLAGSSPSLTSASRLGHVKQTPTTVTDRTRICPFAVCTWLPTASAAIMMAGTMDGSIRIAGAGAETDVKLTAFQPPDVTPATLRGFVESDGYVSIEAAHYSRTVPTQAARWEAIPDVGRTLSGMSVFPVDAPSLTPGPASPCLEYRMYLFHAGKAEVNAILSPTLS